MPTKTRPDPYPGHNFQLIVTGISDDGSAVSGAFSEISGLEVQVKAIEYRNGNEARTVRKIEGLVDLPEPDLQARRHRPRRVLELDQEGCRRRDPARRRVGDPSGREPGRGDALELHPRLAVQVHRARPSTPPTTRSPWSPWRSVSSSSTWTPDLHPMTTTALPGFRVVDAAVTACR